MARKKQDDASYDALRAAVSAGQCENLYVFHGEERYLLEKYLEMIRNLLVSGDFREFNHKKFDSRNFTADELIAACDALPVFAERTLIEVHDVDLFKADEATKDKLTGLFADLPDYICLIFIYDVIQYKPDGRQKFTTVLKKQAKIIDFSLQEQYKLVKWIKQHFSQSGKTIDTPTAEHLAFITGGSMTTLHGEIEKLCSYIPDSAISKADIDTVVTPVLDAVSYKLTDYIVSGRFDKASAVLVDLLAMREPPHKLMYTIALKLRQLMAARLCCDNGMGEKHLMQMCGIRFDFQARNLMSSARKTTISNCRSSVILSAETAYQMNSGGEPDKLLTELLLRLAGCHRRAS